MGIFGVLRRVKTNEEQSDIVQTAVNPPVPASAPDRFRVVNFFSPGQDRISGVIDRAMADNAAPAHDAAESNIIRRYNPKRRLAPF
ncbi:MAG: hypothetical protein A2270_10190 [Elusimicrobia bacterium RIFOXYA12_FULL_51_18]|nr:MAG: hypothetical protein A2270_10190 [Elusimicrobia bacterium RIFOXYA12_FULL_51_18]OGS29566.1 MAG: hypothetical protein A2218_01000 [Elusimicrobia bacterium RIFOXYA2_FULL_53_38]